MIPSMRCALLVLLVGCGGSDDGQQPGGNCSDPAAEASGEGTYYAADGTGNCSFDATPSDLDVAALNAIDYGTADWCGACAT